MHPSELPEHLKDAVREARMDARHEHLNALRDENLTDFERELIAAVREARAHAEGRAAMSPRPPSPARCVPRVPPANLFHTRVFRDRHVRLAADLFRG